MIINAEELGQYKLPWMKLYPKYRISHNLFLFV